MNEPFEPEFIVCPECHAKCQEEHFKAYMDILSGLIGGYVLRCINCRKLSYINVLAKPPLFDLSRKVLGM